MLPGPDTFYQCPKCPNLLYRGSLMSGNTFGSTLYSDGYRNSPMLIEFPDLVKCSKCNTIFWIEKAKELGTYEWGQQAGIIDEHWENAQRVRFLSIEEYFSAIEMQVFNNKEEEIFIRGKIWWGYNDRIRNGEKLHNSDIDKVLWADNINRLMNLLDENNIEQKITIAELNRSLGQFAECMSIINSIDIPEINWLKERVEKECNEKNQKVFQF